MSGWPNVGHDGVGGDPGIDHPLDVVRDAEGPAPLCEFLAGNGRVGRDDPLRAPHQGEPPLT